MELVERHSGAALLLLAGSVGAMSLAQSRDGGGGGGFFKGSGGDSGEEPEQVQLLLRAERRNRSERLRLFGADVVVAVRPFRRTSHLELWLGTQGAPDGRLPPRFAASSEYVGSASSHFTSPDGP